VKGHLSALGYHTSRVKNIHDKSTNANKSLTIVVNA